MPTYSYRCNDCGDAFDIVQSFQDDALTVCPACGGHLRKLFNSVGVVFKGSGFYRTDSRKDSSKDASGSSSSSAKEGSTGKGDSSSSSSSTSSTSSSSSPTSTSD